MILVSKFPLMYYLRKELGILLSIGGYQHLRGETQCLQDFFCCCWGWGYFLRLNFGSKIHAQFEFTFSPATMVAAVLQWTQMQRL